MTEAASSFEISFDLLLDSMAIHPRRYRTYLREYHDFKLLKLSIKNRYDVSTCSVGIDSKQFH
jgi:hypothetical protein